MSARRTVVLTAAAVLPVTWLLSRGVGGMSWHAALISGVCVVVGVSAGVAGAHLLNEGDE